MTLEDYFRDRERHPMFCGERALWMTDTQWEQIQAYSAGIAVPTDEEIVQGIRTFDLYAHAGMRFHKWAWYNVSAVILGDEPFQQWSQLVDQHDFTVDVGL